MSNQDSSNKGLYTPQIVEKPWGREQWFAECPDYLGKILEIRAGQRLSLQRHHRKTETLMLLSGTGTLEVNGVVYDWQPGSAIHIKPGDVHRFAAVTDMVLVEVSTFFPTDVERLEDDYGRG